jgi:hypothetical protein
MLKSGDYRFDVDPNADTTSVTVWRGEGEANGQGPGVKLRSGQQATFSGGTSMAHQITSAPGLDGFDDWCRVRDDREDHAKSYQYVSADVVGAADLDEYGTWRTTPEYGAVWVPAVAPGWAPYHYGHWAWIEPWGWTWVDDAPWGFAPCHYGRWVHYGGYWGWAPGPVVVARPVYAPALVAWVGGPHFGVSLSFGGGGGVGWFPLGWGEPYVPSYHVSRNYFQQVNVTNTHITNITNVTNNYYVTNNNTTVVNNNIQNIHYANQTVTGAVTAVPTRTMTNSEPVARAAVTVPANEVKTASFANAAPVAPVRSSVLGAKAGAPAVAPPTQAMARPVVSHMAPPAKPVPFEAKQEALAQNAGRPLDAQTEAQIRTRVAQMPAPQNNPQAGRPGAPGTPNAATPGAQTAMPGRPGAPNTPAAASMPGKPGAQNPATTTMPAAVAKPGMNPETNANAAQPAAPGRVIPRPPQPGMQPVTGRPMPTAAQPNGGRPMPGTNPSVTETPATAAGHPAQPTNPANENASQPARPTTASTPMPPTAARPVPRPPQADRPMNSEIEKPNSPAASAPRPAPPAETARPVSTPMPPSQPNPGPRPAATTIPRPSPSPAVDSEKPSTPRPQNQPRPTVQRTSQESSPRPQATPRPQSSPRPQAQSRQQQSHSQPKQNHSESKGEHKSENK